MVQLQIQMGRNYLLTSKVTVFYHSPSSCDNRTEIVFSCVDLSLQLVVLLLQHLYTTNVTDGFFSQHVRLHLLRPLNQITGLQNIYQNALTIILNHNLLLEYKTLYHRQLLKSHNSI